ncbi:proline dehydrogenase family protein [Metabacillus sp. JX24]|uniref:proline dehydrogenase family protein n=1 Tax=Metabacillus sp. JX24 TaxID=3240759 RepID=UPI00350EAA70
MEFLFRHFFLFLSKNKWLTNAAKRYGPRFGASRFVAGETIGQAAQVIKGLNQKKLDVTIDYLGEFVDNEIEANEMAEQSIKAIETIAGEQLHSQLSLKLTSMGLDLSDEIVYRNMKRIMEAAKQHGVFVTIDMEDYARCGKTLKLFKELKKEYDLGTVIQAYLYRSAKDLEDLSAYHPNLRLVKGAYRESPQVAFPKKKDTDENFKKLIKMHMQNGHYTAVATHDDAIIEFTKQFVKENRIPSDQFEFQMLYGIRPERQAELAEEGYKMRIYVPYGTDWYGYFMRRLAERPSNALFVLKGIFKK